MKAISNILALLAASIVLSGVAEAQDKASLLHQEVSTMGSTARIALEMKAEPMMELGSGTRVSGLFVDLVRPQETWAMLNPSVSASDLSRPTPRFLLPVTAPRTMNDPAVNEPDFVLLRFTTR